MKKQELYFVPDLYQGLEVAEDQKTLLFEGNQSRSITDKEQDANYWISYRPITMCGKSFQIEITTFKTALGKDFLDELQELVARHSAVE